MTVPVARDEKGRIMKGGGSLNPSGRPKYDQVIVEQARATGETALGILHQIIHDPTAFGPDGWLEQKLQAHFLSMAMDRAYGSARSGIVPDDKPNQTDEKPLISALDSAVRELTEIRKQAALAQPIDVTPGKPD